MRISSKSLIPLGVFLGSLAVGYIALAWTSPGSNPPANNVLPPLNISGNAQYKTGNLYLGAASSSPFTLNVQANGADLASLWVDKATVLNGNSQANSTLSVGSPGGNVQICLNGDCISRWPQGGVGAAVYFMASNTGQTLGTGGYQKLKFSQAGGSGYDPTTGDYTVPNTGVYNCGFSGENTYNNTFSIQIDCDGGRCSQPTGVQSLVGNSLSNGDGVTQQAIFNDLLRANAGQKISF